MEATRHNPHNDLAKSKMLKRFWRWLWGQPEPDKLAALMEIVIANQEKTFQGVLNAVAQIGQASEKQAEVLSQYLKLFQTPGDPTRWEHDPEAENNEDLTKMGFPSGGTDSEQASWVLDNISRL